VAAPVGAVHSANPCAASSLATRCQAHPTSRNSFSPIALRLSQIGSCRVAKTLFGFRSGLHQGLSPRLRGPGPPQRSLGPGRRNKVSSVLRLLPAPGPSRLNQRAPFAISFQPHRRRPAEQRQVPAVGLAIHRAAASAQGLFAEFGRGGGSQPAASSRRKHSRGAAARDNASQPAGLWENGSRHGHACVR